MTTREMIIALTTIGQDINRLAIPQDRKECILYQMSNIHTALQIREEMETLELDN